jgi:GT2 family glycosyltransferase
MLVSVVVLTYNRCADLKRCLDSLERQTFRQFEIVVVDNGSTDGTSKLLEQYRVRVIRNDVKNKAYLRNIGWRTARGDIVAYIDDDAEALPDWLASIMGTFEKFPQAGAVGGPTIVTNRQDMLSLYESSKHSKLLRVAAKVYDTVILEKRLFDVCRFFESGAYSIGGSLPQSTKLGAPIVVDILSTCNAAVRKNVIEKVNGFDEHFFFNHEDGDFFLRIGRAGYQLLFDPKAAVLHHVNPKAATRASPFYIGRDFGYFYAKDARPKTLPNMLRYLLNIIFFNTYWLYRTFQFRNVTYVHGIYGFISGVQNYLRAKNKTQINKVPLNQLVKLL